MMNQYAHPSSLFMNLNRAHPAPTYAQPETHRVVLLSQPAQHARHYPIPVPTVPYTHHHAHTSIPATSIPNHNGPQRVVVLQAADTAHYQTAPPSHHNNVRVVQHHLPPHHLLVPPAPMVAQAPGVSYVRHVLPTNRSQHHHTSIPTTTTGTSYNPSAITTTRPVTTAYVDLEGRPVHIVAQQGPVASRVHVDDSTAALPPMLTNSGSIENTPRGSLVVDARGKKGKMYSKRCMVNATKWNQKYQDLKAFQKDHGHCLVPTRFKSNPSLACWVMHQRAYYRAMLRGEQTYLTKERIDMLESIGFVWEVRSRQKR